MSGAKNDSARASAAMRGPSRQTTSALVAGACVRAATARARSEMTRPSAPSATLASVSGRSGASSSAGDWLKSSPSLSARACKWKSRTRRNIGVSCSAGTSACAGHPGQQVVSRCASSRCSYWSSSASLKLADMGVGEAAHDQVGLADAAMPGPEQQPPPPGSRPSLDRVLPVMRCSNAKSPAGAGRGIYIETVAAGMSAARPLSEPR